MSRPLKEKKGTFCFFFKKKQNVPFFPQRGWSYVEVLVATVLLALALAPALEAMQTALLGAAIHEEHAIHQQRLASRLEQLLAQPFNDLDAAAAAAGSKDVPTTYSDNAGTKGRRLVFLSRYDGDNADGDDKPFTGTDAGLLWIKVEVENTVISLETLFNE
jgi:Tfp pilus assembly protein PilV